MSFKRVAGSCLRSFARMPVASAFFQHPRVRQTLQRLPGSHQLYGMGWDLKHPFDGAHGTDTSGFVPPESLERSSQTTTRSFGFASSQPSITRAALQALPSAENFTFIDLGCGKGRPLLVATEFPFKELIGVELSEGLAECARRNANIMGARHPQSRPVRIEVGDAIEFALPGGDLVVFLYNSFGPDLIRRVIGNIEKALAAEQRSIFIVSYNPLHGACMDSSPHLRRYFAAMIPYAAEECGFGPDAADAVVIWQGGSSLPAKPGADRKIVMTNESRAELAA